jgi:hypothetical protein
MADQKNLINIEDIVLTGCSPEKISGFARDSSLRDKQMSLKKTLIP